MSRGRYRGAMNSVGGGHAVSTRPHRRPDRIPRWRGYDTVLATRPKGSPQQTHPRTPAGIPYPESAPGFFDFNFRVFDSQTSAIPGCRRLPPRPCALAHQDWTLEAVTPDPLPAAGRKPQRGSWARISRPIHPRRRTTPGSLPRHLGRTRGLARGSGVMACGRPLC